MITGRFAPTPSGPMHLGNARTALLAWLDVRARGGRMLLRIEDLDRERCRGDHADGVRRDLEWLGLDWDGETAPQSTRDRAYALAVSELSHRGLAYACFCTRRDLAIASAPHGTAAGGRRYPGTCALLAGDERARRLAGGVRAAVRVRMPEDPVVFVDRVHGPVSQQVGRTVGDIVVRRSDGLHAYQLAVVVDDAADGVTDVLRGDDLLGSTPRQIVLQRLLGLPTPSYAHVPLLTGADGVRLAKRHASVSIAQLRADGQHGPAIVGRLAASLGLVARDAVVAPPELIAGFSVDRVPRASTGLDPAALG
jgi:glutamyl-tRNA synthetase